MLISGLAPLVLVAVIAINVASNEVSSQAFHQLEAVKQNKARAVERYFSTIEGQLTHMAAKQHTLSAMRDFSASFESMSSESQLQAGNFNDARSEVKAFYDTQFAVKYQNENQGAQVNTEALTDGLDRSTKIAQYLYIADNSHPLGEKHNLDAASGSSPYHAHHREYHPEIRQFLETFGFYDIFLIDPNSGKIVYSVFKELDYGTSLIDGPYKNTNFAEAFRDALTLEQGEVVLKDFASYTPSYEAPASFMASPIYAGNTLEGVLVFQMPLEVVNAIMGERTGMGESGETYLVGDDYLMRSDSYQDPLNRTVAASFRHPDKGEVRTDASIQALSGSTSEGVITDYRGLDVLSSYAPLNIEQLNWAIVAEIDKSEALAGVSALRWTIMVIGAVIGAAIFVFALFTSRLISAPILRLSKTILEIEQDGNFDLRIDNNQKDEIGQTSRSVNKLLENLSGAINDTNTVLSKLSKGDFSCSVSEHYRGQLGLLARGANQANKQVQEANAEQAKQAKIAETNAANAEALAEEAATQARETMIVKQALDSSATAALITDDKLKIVYSNCAADTLFKASTSAFSAEGIALNTQAVMDESASTLPLQALAIDDLQKGKGRVEQISVSDRTFEITTSAILDENKVFLGAVLEWVDLTETLAQQAAERRTAEENSRIREALDVSSTSTMIADKDFQIIYTNAALNKLMKAGQKDLREYAGQFDADQLVGTNMGIFHKDPNEKRALDEDLTDTVQKEINAGQRTFAITANPIIDKDANRIGTVVEWLDRSAEVAIESEIDNIIEVAASGDFGQQLDTDNKDGFFLRVSEGLNQLLQTTNIALEDVIRVLSAIADGDLSQRIERDYSGEFGLLKQGANTTIDKLISVVDQIKTGSSSIARAANEITQGNADLSQRTEEQASSLEQTASSMEEMTQTLKSTEDNATNANEAAQTSVSIARKGNESVEHISKAMNEISASSEKISNIISVIDEIAFQTNLLALNAAVEAARAGEQGRGFAVVAGEVRQLAQRSASAAKEIKDLINDSVEKVSDGSRLVDQSGETLRSIVTEIEQVGDYMSELLTSSKEQSIGVQQVGSAVTQMDQMTQQNAALVEQATAATEHLAGQAEQLDELVSFFKS